MKMTLPYVLLSFLAIVSLSKIRVFAEDIPYDITSDRQFGCNWYSSSRVVCKCTQQADEMFIQNNIPSFDTTTIEITNCDRLRFGSDSIVSMRNLRLIQISNARHLQFEEKALRWFAYRQVSDRFDVSVPSLKVFITNSTIVRLSSHTFSGTINEININNATIVDLQPFAFSNLRQTEKITITNTDITDIQQQPFKKFATEILELHRVTSDEIPSRTFSDVIVYRTFTISDCTFGAVRSGAFSIAKPERFVVSGTRIDLLAGEAFKVVTRGDVTLRDNVFYETHGGCFDGIELDRETTARGATMTLESNTFTVLSKDSMRVRNFTPIFVNINVNASCNCKSIDRELKESVFYAEIRCLYDGEYVTVREFKSGKCSVISSHLTGIVVGCVMVALAGAVVVGLFCYYKMAYRSRTYGSAKHSKKPGQLSMIVPDGRTYRETELHVIVERTDLLTTDL